MEWNDRGVILRHGWFREADMWLKILFRERGLATAFAFGAAKSKIRFCGCLDTFNTIDARIKTSSRNNYINLQEASLIATPSRLRKNWRLMGVGHNCLRFIEAVDIDPAASAKCFELTENLRAWLEESSSPKPLATSFFRMRLAGLLGYAPDFGHCAVCGREPIDGAIFRADEGLTYCLACAPDTPDRGRTVSLAPRALASLRSTDSSLPGDWEIDVLDGSDRRACSRLADAFIEYHLGLKWDNGFFRRV